MATLFKNKIYTNAGLDEVTALTTAGNARTTVLGLSLTNLIDSPIQVSVRVYDPEQDLSAFFIRNVIIPQGQSLRAINGGERLVLAPNTSIKIVSNAVDSLDFILSYVEIV